MGSVSVTVTDPGTFQSVSGMYLTTAELTLPLTSPVTGSIEGRFTSFNIQLEVNFLEGELDQRRQLNVEGSFVRELATEVAFLVYFAECFEPEVNVGDYVTTECGDNRRVIYCSEP
eukprot:UN20920